ncbi:2-keto-3-deoxy-phosphogalactonate aldolase [Cnuella takakiae]|uniref:2-keto-3-deoxy-phosphogalactonate aldolase n=1 Tax=Cnuella takakiae TaxID=1302690 RepID=A0A1M5A0H8_9BACT|nr:bifunctional 4-hydroxy-2-oxoglutarate aldolase/2-dehydro-3-deoxy-phosphogluconate aldolase [Cnuella takakiae]OLY92139.1 2-dehydro-3-deoxyphosphogluconate aldolase [Cnuella takakiae]SHF23803.1 2-keto-3-deoxy-phosphogalactonate aldolase [Cnuella takakiae]
MVLEQIKEHQVIAILRGLDPAMVLPVAEALYAGGIRLVELTLNSPGALPAIEALTATLKDRMLVGAGTVLDAAEARNAIAAGARFIISPTLDADTIRATRDLGAVSIPGAYTPTEVLQAHRAGGQIIKVFPAQSPAYIRDLRAPLSHILLMPTGGVGVENIRDFKKAGGVGFGIGSALVDARKQGEPNFLSQITGKATALLQALYGS